MIFRACLYDNVHYCPGNYDQPGINGSVLSHPFYLDDNSSVGIPYGLGRGKGLYDGGLPFHAYVAPVIRSGTPDKCDIYGESLVKKPFTAVNFNYFNYILGCNFVQLSTPAPGVYERVKTYVGNSSGLAGGYIPEKVGNDSLRKVISLYGISGNKLSYLGSESPVPPYDPFQKSFVGEMVDTPFLAIPLSRPVDNGQPPESPSGEISFPALW